jgi:allantoicase
MTTTTNELSDFTDLVDLANDRLGGAAVACSDDFFAGMHALTKPHDATFDVNAYGDHGKIMDGWESRRSHRNELGADGAPSRSDWCIVRLGAPGIVRGVVIDTAFFRGNFPSHALLEGTSVDGHPSPAELEGASWVTLIEKSALQGDFKNKFAVKSNRRVTHVRLKIFPDGGVARLRVFGEPLADLRLHGGADASLELSAAELGGIVVSCSDMFFGSRHNLLFPGNSGGMHDGWETRRSRRVGFDWAVVKLGVRGVGTRVVVDTSHFKGNCPETFALDATAHYAGAQTQWTEVLCAQRLQPHTRHVFHEGIVAVDATHVRLRIVPDGGVARFRLFGTPSELGKAAHRMARINAMLPREADQAFLSCCGSRAWAAEMAGARPWADEATMMRAADEAYAHMKESDWLEAFAAHPKIGGNKPAGQATAHSQAQSATEQAGMASASLELQTKMHELNEAYEKKHGFIYIVKASGKSAAELLAFLEQRVKNERAAELVNAADEQKKITALRLSRIC